MRWIRGTDVVAGWKGGGGGMDLAWGRMEVITDEALGRGWTRQRQNRGHISEWDGGKR